MSAPPLPDAFGNYALGDFVEVVPPEAINWLPQTVGWVWLALAALLVSAHYTWKSLRHWYRNRYRREAAERLQKLVINLEGDQIVAELNRLLKLVALAAYSRDRVARLSGDSWVEFLRRECITSPFSEPQLQLLAFGGYRQEAVDPSTAQGLLEAALQWIRDHRGAEDV